MITRKLSYVVGLALLLAPIGCAHQSASHKSAAAKDSAIPSPLRVGIAGIYPPLAFKDTGQLTGIEVELARKMGADLGVQVALVELPWEQLIPALEDGRIDVIMSGMSITEERSRRVHFTIPYLDVGQMALIRRADRDRLNDRNRMNEPSSRVGFLSGTTSEGYSRKNLPRAQLTGFDSTDAGVAALRARKIDFWVQDAPAIWRITGNLQAQNEDLVSPYRMLTDEYLAWGVRKSDNELRERLNVALLQWQQTGQLDGVLDSWITIRKVAVDPSKARY
jgi:polar amino acid transport system substrate-binding protein